MRTHPRRCGGVDRATFTLRTETFGLDVGDCWAEGAFRLLFNVPRSFQPLVEAWEHHHPGTIAALNRLVDRGLVAWQGPVIVDTRTGALAERSSRRLHRYRTTARGRRLLEAAAVDLRDVESAFPKTSPENMNSVLRLLAAADLDGSHARWGLSGPHLIELSGLAERSGRWWIHRLVEAGLLRRLPHRVADIREVVPAHWRVTRPLCRQLSDVLTAFGGPTHWRAEFRLGRERFLTDIEPARLGISGATDYDHDVEAQRILAALLRSPRCASDGRMVVEPRWFLPLSKSTNPPSFTPDGPHTLFYRPDAELVERDDRGLRRCVVEYERYQSRRDGWNHIERFLGWCHTRLLPVETAVLRFVVDSPARVRSYVELIEAFADWGLDHPEALPANALTLAVASSEMVQSAADPLDPRVWHRIALPSGDIGSTPVIHDRRRSPYEEYFTR